MQNYSLTTRFSDLMRSDNNSIESTTLQLRRVLRFYIVLVIIAVSQLLGSLKAKRDVVIFRAIYASLFVLSAIILFRLCHSATLKNSTIALWTVASLLSFNMFYFIHDLIVTPSLWAMFSLVSLIVQAMVVGLVYQVKIKIQEEESVTAVHPAATAPSVDIEQPPPLAPAIVLKEGDGASSGLQTTNILVTPVSVKVRAVEVPKA